MTITASGPLSRHITEYLTDQRVKHYKCKTLQNPDFFFDGRVYGSVDAAYRYETSTDKAGGLWLRNKGIVSVGTKKSDDAYKLFGLRPDENQGGSESVEWSVESIEINGKAQTINLRDRLEVSPITTKFGDNLYVQRARQRCRIMVPGDPSTESFKVCLRLHLKGCAVQYRADLDEYWIYRGSTFFCRLGKPYLVDMDLNPLEGDFVRHSLVEIGKGEYRYIKEPTPAFAMANLPSSYLIDADTVYSSTADGYVSNSGSDWDTVHNAATGSASDATGSQYDAGGFIEGSTYYCYRIFQYFDVSGITHTAGAVTWYGYTRYRFNGVIACQKGTQGASLGTGDYAAFTGGVYGTHTVESNKYNPVVFDATGISDVDNTASTFNLCVRENTRDVSDVTPTGGQTVSTFAIYASETASTTYDPYLYITTAAAASYIHGIMGHHFIPSFMGGR